MRALELPDGNGLLRYIDIAGREPTRVYLHGLGFSSDSLVHIAAHPALCGRRSLLVDLLGFGLSDKPEGNRYSIEDHAATVTSLLDDQQIRNCELIGHSLGGSIAIVVASKRPDLVSSLVVVEANLDPGIGPFSARILAMSEEEYVRTGFRSALEQLREGAKDDRLSAITLGMQQVASAQAMYRTARSLVAERSPTYRDLLVQLKMTRWFLVGSETLEQPERPASGESGEGLDGTGVKLMVVPNAGHLMPLQNPAGCAEALARALIDER